MRRLSCSIIFTATLLLVNADDGWTRLAPPAVPENRATNWARSGNTGGNRVPFVPDDIALPPPWLIPHQQPAMGFPAAQAQVRSFFDEEPIEWPPRPASSKTLQSQPAQPAQPGVIHTSLQPPRQVVASASSIKPVQHIWYEGDRRPSPNVGQRSQPDARVNQQVVSHHQSVQPHQQQHQAVGKKWEPSVPVPVSSTEINEPYRSVQVEESLSVNGQQRHQDKQQPTASRKSVTSTYDSSEYDEMDDGTSILAGRHEDKKTINSKSSYDLPDEEAFDQVAAVQDDVYNNPVVSSRRHQPVQQQSRRHQQQQQQPPNSAEQVDQLERHQNFDSSKTIFRNHVNAGQNFRQQQQPARPADLYDSYKGKAPNFVDETPERQSPPTQSTKSQSSVRRQQQQQQQQQKQHHSSERNPSVAPEGPAYEIERPHFKSPNLQAPARPSSVEAGSNQNDRQYSEPSVQEEDEWPAQRPVKQRPYRPEEPELKATGSRRNRPKNPPAQNYPESQEQIQENRDHGPRGSPRQPNYRPEGEEENYDQPEEHHQPHYEPNSQPAQAPAYNHQRPRRPTESRPFPEYEPAQNNPRPPYPNDQTEENDPYDGNRPQPTRDHEQNHEQQPYEHPPVEESQPSTPAPPPPPPTRRPRPPFRDNEDQPFHGAEGDSNDGDFNQQPGQFNGPPNRPHHPQGGRQRPPRPPHRPRESVVTQGLNTLKNLVGLTTGQRPRHPPPPHGFNQDGRVRPDGYRGRRPLPHHPDDEYDNVGELGRQDHSEGIDEFDPSSSFVGQSQIQGRHNVQTEEEPMEHRSDVDDEDLAPAATASTESTTRTTAQPVKIEAAEPTVPVVPSSSTAAPEEAKSTLFPPFNKRVRPQPPSPAQTESKTSGGKDGSASGQLRITSYKQRIEAMKERARLREQQQQAQPKKDVDLPLELSDTNEPVAKTPETSTSSTTARPSTTRPKMPPRMPVRKPLTSAAAGSTSSTTESVPVSRSEKLDKTDKVDKPEESNFEQYKRRFKPKSTLSRRPAKEDEASLPAEMPQEELPITGRKNLFGKLPGSPFTRRRAQHQQEEEDRQLAENNAKTAVKEEVAESIIPPRFNKEGRRRPGSFARTTTTPSVIESSIDGQEESDSVLAPPNQWPATLEPEISVKSSPSPVQEEEEELPKIELVSVSSYIEDGQEKKAETPVQEIHADNIPSQPAGQTFIDKPDQPIEPTDEEEPSSPLLDKPRHSFFTMATNDPILPIEELLNIRVRDNGKGM